MEIYTNTYGEKGGGKRREKKSPVVTVPPRGNKNREKLGDVKWGEATAAFEHVVVRIYVLRKVRYKQGKAKGGIRRILYKHRCFLRKIKKAEKCSWGEKGKDAGRESKKAGASASRERGSCVPRGSI